MLFWLVLFLLALALYLGLPFLYIFFEIVGAWQDHWFDRLEEASTRFCRKRGWY